MTIELSEEEFLGTMSDDMLDITETEGPAVDIWNYVSELSKDGIVVKDVFENRLVEMVYRNEEDLYDHVLLPTDDENKFMVIVIDVEEKKIMGHYSLDLDEEYEEEEN